MYFNIKCIGKLPGPTNEFERFLVLETSEFEQPKFDCRLFLIVSSGHLRFALGPSINRLVTDGNTKLCCGGFVLALFQSTTSNQIDSEHTRDYTKLFLVWKVEIIQVAVNKI